MTAEKIATPQEISEAAAALGQLGPLGRAFTVAAKVLPALQGAVQTLAELDKRIAEKRAEGEAVGEREREGLNALGQTEYSRLVSKGRAQLKDMQDLRDTARQEYQGLLTKIDTAKTELADLDAKVARVKAALG